MKALLCEALGPAENLVIRDLPEPEPRPGEIAIRVKAAALNFFDTLVIQGRYQVKPPLPFSPSAECAGVVSAVGDGVTDWQIGERAAVWLGHGAARETVVVPTQAAIRIPEELSDHQAAGLFVTYGTAMHGLIQRGGIKPGETLAILGAAGGAGLAAVEIGALLGARVIACASSPEKLALAREHGAQEGLDYAADDLRAGLRRLAPQGLDALYDTVGGELAEPSLRSMGWGGRYLVVGFAGGEIPKIPLNLLLLKGCDLRGVFWGDFVRRDPAGHRANMERLLAWAAAGQIRAHVHGAFPLEQAAEALALIAGRKVQGKVVLVP
ncbi:NADPH:quinone oxidoreductase family protein [Bosea sp. (in: a-proteobacteria)]|jgi:NADPH2:quinone reductase|uniref:NADPH:quinone oxidoreductase family protein n=1 Tax=Bosea sp. (in: a-proteobacteria) TaxID=1871050 RepID=UPI0025C376FF|nr:NADPH:quinone oxidoreductase family protein [Bosea sp. (in: a-proteobacteria)]MBR3194162.1 NADPH:quinone oxidoreductase family protein [Bosea sp. (in: a-proteobacteria)]